MTRGYLSDAKKIGMSDLATMPLIGNKIFVPKCFSHKEDDDVQDEYFILMDISETGNALNYTVTRLMGGKYGRISTDHDDTLQLELDEFRIFRGYYMRTG